MKSAPKSPATPDRLVAQLLAWYDQNRRTLPWRARPGEAADPYRVWLSEIMLQQTTVATVTPRFDEFLARWPTLEALAAAPLDDVLHEWQGLGYYARARNLHRCAQAVVATHGGAMPADETALRGLPGIGAYTAAAIAAIAFDRPAIAVDGNVERVMARFHCIETPLPAAKKELTVAAHALTPTMRAGDVAQALMELGATVCSPRQPLCGQCPWRADCAGYAAGLAPVLPRRAPRVARPVRRGLVFWLEDAQGRVLLRRRPETGLLAGMHEIPSTPWRAAPWALEEGLAHVPAAADWRLLAGEVVHVFTHFRLDLQVARGRTVDGVPDGDWSAPDRFGDYALPTVMKKVAALVGGQPE
ncbi:MAG: A/G-specific adenine glycosylase [Alphaproteobacteria bacterium]|nr:A/G-specific adenine glycosylase [Alphaproteobacteria bacterium]